MGRPLGEGPKSNPGAQETEAPPRVLVTGGTGAVGRPLVQRLREEGYAVRVYARHALRDAPAGVEAFSGDVQDALALAQAASGAQAVVHMVGILREGPGQSFYGVHVEGTRNALHAATQAGVRRFVHVSGLLPREGTAPRDPLSLAKALAEEEVRRSGLDYTVLRASLVFGVSPSVLDRIAWSLRVLPPLVLLPCGGRGLFQPLWVGDLATCVAACLKEGRGVGRGYDLGGPETWSYRDLVRLLAQGQGLRRLGVPVPVRLLAWVASATAAALRRPPSVTAVELQQLCMDNRTDPEVLLRDFGISPARLEERIGSLTRGNSFLSKRDTIG